MYGVCAETLRMLYSSFSSRFSILKLQQENKEIFSWYYEHSIQIFLIPKQKYFYLNPQCSDRVFQTLEIIKNGTEAKVAKRQFIYKSSESIY